MTTVKHLEGCYENSFLIIQYVQQCIKLSHEITIIPAPEVFKQRFDLASEGLIYIVRQALCYVS